MSDSLKVECPHCGGSLKLKDRSAEGKRVRCPKCQEAFKVELPDEDLDIVDDLEDDLGDDFGGDDELPEEDEAPRSSKKAASKKPVKKKRKSGSGAMPWLVIAGVLGVLVVVGGVGAVVALSGGGDTSTNKIDMTYLPADTNMVMHMKVNEFMSSPLLADVMNQPAAQQMMGPLVNEAGVGWREMVSVTVGTIVDETDTGAKFSGPGLLGPQQGMSTAQPRMVTVIRASSPLKAEDIAVKALKGRAVTQNGKTYYEGLNVAPGSPLAGMSMWAPESNTVVFGTSAEILALVQAPNHKQIRRREFDFINPNTTLLMALALKLPSNPSAEIKSPASQPHLQDLERSVNKTLRGGMFGVRISDRVDLEIIAKCADSGGAGELKKTIDVLFSDLKSQFEQQKGLLKAVGMTDVIDLGDKSLASLKVEQNGQLLTAMGTIPSEVKAVGQSLAQKMPGMIGAMGGPGGPPGRGGSPPTIPQSSSVNPGFPTGSEIPPGALPPGAIPPGALPPGALPPGGLPPGAVPPGGTPPPQNAKQ